MAKQRTSKHRQVREALHHKLIKKNSASSASSQIEPINRNMAARALAVSIPPIPPISKNKPRRLKKRYSYLMAADIEYFDSFTVIGNWRGAPHNLPYPSVRFVKFGWN
jgi:hypothetical protein